MHLITYTVRRESRSSGYPPCRARKVCFKNCELIASEQGVDRGWDGDARFSCPSQGSTAGRHSCSADGCNVVAARLAVVVAVDLAVERVADECAANDRLLGLRCRELTSGRLASRCCSMWSRRPTLVRPVVMWPLHPACRRQTVLSTVDSAAIEDVSARVHPATSSWPWHARFFRSYQLTAMSLPLSVKPVTHTNQSANYREMRC